MALRIWSSLFGHRRPRSGNLPRRAPEAGALRREQSGGVAISDHATHSAGPPQAVLVQEPGRSAAGDRPDGGISRGGEPGTTVRATRESAFLRRADGKYEREAPDHVRPVRGGGLFGAGDRRDARRPAGHGLDAAVSRAEGFLVVGEEAAAGGAEEEMIPMGQQTGEPSHDPDTEAAIELLRGVTAPPPEPEMKRRVWAALVSAETRPAVIVSRTLRLPKVVAAAAGAAPGVAPPSKKVASRRLADLPAGAQAEPAVDLTVPEPAPVIRQSRGTRRTAPFDRSVRPVEAPAALPSPRERAEVLDAMVALRRDHAAARAGQLLDRYLTARPHGALREEALALAIEAADARGDKTSVSNWARAYQTDYPSGRFAGFARFQVRTP